MEVEFWEIATIILHSATLLNIEEVVLLPVYLGRGASIIRVENILPEGNVA